MQYWTKNGSIPSTETDGTEGWQQAPEPPTEVPSEKELVWLNWEWVVREPKPTDRLGFQWNWDHEQMAWIEYPFPGIDDEQVLTTPLDVVSNLTTSQDWVA